MLTKTAVSLNNTTQSEIQAPNIPNQIESSYIISSSEPVEKHNDGNRFFKQAKRTLVRNYKQKFGNGPVQIGIFQIKHKQK
jgi:hypothetical protein